MDSVTNRIALTFIIVALIIGSSILATAEFAPEFKSHFGLPLVSIAGFSAAGFLGVILFYLILRIRKYK